MNNISDVITFRKNEVLKFHICNSESQILVKLYTCEPSKEYQLLKVVFFQEGRVDPKSDGYVAGYKNKKSADAKMRPS